MDYEKLLEPYIENGRTIAKQITWLLKNNIPQTSIDYAISHVYKRLENGEIFGNGNELDQELRNIARKHNEDSVEEQYKKRIEEIENNLDAKWNKLSKTKKIWEVLRDRA